MGMQGDKVRFNVGGKIFETTAATLATVSRNPVFGSMFDDQRNLRPRESNKEYFIDRDPECFSVLLNLLRTGELHVPPSIPEKLLYKEALFYGLLENVRTAKWGRFHGNQLNLSTSVKGRDPYSWTAIKASPDGGCAVAHGSMVHIYNWMLEEKTPLDLDYRQVNDFGWIDSENIVVSAGKISGQEAGAMGHFSSSTGNLTHRYEVKSQKVGPLCFNSDNKIFASCTGGIGVWDQVTGIQTDFFNSPRGWPLGDADKIQWLNGRNCLMASASLRTDYQKRLLCLLDFRVKSMVWSWSTSIPVQYIYDPIAIEESNSICVAGIHADLGFIDLRTTYIGSIRWNPRNVEIQKYGEWPCYPKLTLNGGQIFYSSGWKEGISVFSGPEYSILTSSLGKSSSVTFRDFSIGGDRLFSLHKEENVFDVWETPCPPIV